MKLSSHAGFRHRKRGISPDLIQKVFQWGLVRKSRKKKGARVGFLPVKLIPRYFAVPAEARGLVAVLSEDGVVLTAYWRA